MNRILVIFISGSTKIGFILDAKTTEDGIKKAKEFLNKKNLQIETAKILVPEPKTPKV